MQQNDLDQSIRNLGMLTQFFQQQCLTLTDELKQEHSILLQQQKNDIIQTLRQNMREEWHLASKQYIADMESIRNKVVFETQSLNQNLHQIKLKSKQAVFHSWLAVLGSLLFLLIGSVLLGFHYQKVIQKQKNDADVLELIGKSDIVRCGDSLCAKVQSKGKSNQYLEIKKR